MNCSLTSHDGGRLHFCVTISTQTGRSICYGLLSALFLFPICQISAFGQNASGRATLDGNTSSAPSLGYPLVHRDPAGLDLIEKAVSSLGGGENLAQVQAAVVSAQLQSSADGKSSSQINAEWTESGNESRVLYVSAAGKKELVSGHGRPFVRTGKQSTNLPAWTLYSHVCPPLIGVLLRRQLQDPAYSFEDAGQSVYGGRRVYVIKAASNESPAHKLVTSQTWYLDAETYRPIRLDYLVPDIRNPQISMHLSLLLSDYREKSGIYVPFSFEKRASTTVLETGLVTSITLNVAVPEGTFDRSTESAQ